MSFAPVLPASGITGWAFLNRTLSAQKAAFEKDGALQGDMAYFRENIGKVKTADQLMGDRRLLRVALEAHGLRDDLPNRAFIQKVLESSSFSAGTLTNRLADKRYQAFSQTFGFGDFATPNTQRSDFADKILSAFRERRFEEAVGSQDENLRLAMNAQRELGVIAARPGTENGRWYSALASPPLRQVLQTAFGLPSSFLSIDIDRQLTILKSKAQSLLGQSDLAAVSDPRNMDKLIRQYLFRSDAATSSPTSPALTLLQGTATNRLSLYA